MKKECVTLKRAPSGNKNILEEETSSGTQNKTYEESERETKDEKNEVKNVKELEIKFFRKEK